MDETKFWVVAFAAMALYGLMQWAEYALAMTMNRTGNSGELRV